MDDPSGDNNDQPATSVSGETTARDKSDSNVFDEVLIDSDCEDGDKCSNGSNNENVGIVFDDDDDIDHEREREREPEPASEDKKVKDDKSSIMDTITLSSDEDDDNCDMEEDSKERTLSSPVQMESSPIIPTNEAIAQLIDDLICKNVNENFELRCQKIEDDFELITKDLQNGLEQCWHLNQVLDKLSPEEIHIFSEGVINHDGSLTIDDSVQRVIKIDPVLREICGNIPIDEEDTQINLGRLKAVTQYADIDVVQVATAADLQEKYKLPKSGPVVRAPLSVGDSVFATTNPLSMAKSNWLPAIIIEIAKCSGKVNYNVTYEDSYLPPMVLKKAQIAYRQTPSVMLPIKTRVVAAVDVSLPGTQKNLSYYSGLIAEIARRTNSFRYLVFFDNGAVAYVKCDDVYLIVDESLTFLDNAPEENKPFLRKYFNDLPERALVRYYKGSRDFVLNSGKWIPGKVKKVDCSIVRFYFRSLDKYEWIYRGSPRLKPLSSLLKSSTSPPNSENKLRAPRKTTVMYDQDRALQPFVQYTRDEEMSSEDEAKISTSRSGVIVRPRADPFNQPVQTEFEFFPELFQLPERKLIPKMFVPHKCNTECVNHDYELKKYRDVNPFVIPVICGWDRQIALLSAATRKKKREIFYVAPCGRRLRTIEEVDKYLELTQSELPIDLFTFFSQLSLYSDLGGKRTQGCYYYEPDIAQGTENHSISVINWVNDDPITPGFVYWPTRFPGRGLSLELDPHFLMCCDCTDNCRDRNKCDCQRLSIDSFELVRYLHPDIDDCYQFRRLRNIVTTGIWECNPNCACSHTCNNRLVQHGIRVLLQIFRTEKKGWGIRCLHDIPPYTFICIYAAEVLNEELANEVGSTYGDEYLADLDYIENVERFKEHYEDTAMHPPSSSEESNSSETSDHEPDYSSRQRTRKKSRAKSTSSSKRKAKGKERLKKIKLTGKRYREMFGEKSAYSLDAKRKGNVGRYFNHSCDPNCFVQNVFIDSHDLRFPWVALFSHKFIPAFTELVWDYNYEIIEGRKMWCHCGASNCRGRLL